MKIKDIIKKVFSFKKNKCFLKEASYENKVMKIEYTNGVIEEYYGSGTVWRVIPHMQRCSTPIEMYLSEIYNYIKHYGNTYPNSHKSK